jgi:Ca-activated chloride channel homolog
MNWSIRFAYFELLYCLVPLLLAAAWYRLNYYKKPVYSFPLTHKIIQSVGIAFSWRDRFFFVTRFFITVALALLIARPQRVDQHSKVIVEGIDIMMVLDVSGSMQLFDDPYDKKERIAIAKEEAINFIKKRNDDPIGLVFFGKDAVSRCPLTLDKSVLIDIIKDIELGIIDHDGTVISKALITALNRLKKSKAVSKIIILLTDGEPTPGDLHPDDVIALAQQYGVKIYTIGIGGQYGGLYEDPFFGIRQAGVPLNAKLLKKFAEKTGARSFVASNQAELKEIYSTINQLEKTEHETDVYHNYYDMFMPLLFFLALIILFELVCLTFMWFGL